MVKRLLILLLAIPLGVAVIALAVTNRQPVTLAVPPAVDDVPFASATLPLFVVLFIVLLVGMVLGSLATWFSQSRYRREAREKKVEATRAEFEAQKQKERAEALSRQVVAESDAKSADPEARRSAAFASLGLPAPGQHASA